MNHKIPILTGIALVTAAFVTPTLASLNILDMPPKKPADASSQALPQMAVQISASAPVAATIPASAPAPVSALAPASAPAPAVDQAAAIESLKTQLQQVQQQQDKLATNENNEPLYGTQLTEIDHRLDRIEDEMETVGAALIHVNFGFNSARFMPTPRLGRSMVIAGRKARRIDISGHTDSIGSEAANHAMALARALSAKQYLTNRGVGKNKVYVFSGGSGDPISDNSTAEGRAQNRRVDVEFVR
jgi:outer membrane protein OmpA-like peptidoglycan-associated protein